MNQYIDHTNLKPTASVADITRLCEEAKMYHFKSVCIHGAYVPLAVQLLKDSPVEVCSVIGFPLGANSTATKVFEAQDASDAGAHEIDMVINLSKVKAQDEAYLVHEIQAIKKVLGDKVLKVIIETCLLSDDEKIFATQCVIKGGADFVKTSTGFSTGGVTIEDVKLLAQVADGKIKVKAAGGVRSYEDLKNMIEAGANRIGTSSGVKLMQGEKTEGSY